MVNHLRTVRPTRRETSDRVRFKYAYSELNPLEQHNLNLTSNCLSSAQLGRLSVSLSVCPSVFLAIVSAPISCFANYGQCEGCAIKAEPNQRDYGAPKRLQLGRGCHRDRPGLGWGGLDSFCCFCYCCGLHVQHSQGQSQSMSKHFHSN